MLIPAKLRSIALIALLALAATVATAGAEEFRIGIMQSQAGVAKKYEALGKYLEKKGIDVKLVTTTNYNEAADMFAKGGVDGLFSGSAVAGVMIMKGIAYPVVRPVDNNGRSTYWAVVVGKKGSPTFTGKAAYFNGKKVATCAAASSGEFFFRALPGSKQSTAQVVIADNHGAAIDMVEKGSADFAIVKNMVWTANKTKYSNVIEVGSDGEQNPNDTLIVSKKTDQGTVKKLIAAMTAIGKDPSPEAKAALDALGIREYIMTSPNDFGHTMELLSGAGVTAGYVFK